MKSKYIIILAVIFLAACPEEKPEEFFDEWVACQRDETTSHCKWLVKTNMPGYDWKDAYILKCCTAERLVDCEKFTCEEAMKIRQDFDRTKNKWPMSRHVVELISEANRNFFECCEDECSR